MSGSNLVVINDGVICFSPFFKKHNGIPFKISLINYIDPINGRFVIPISTMGLLLTVSSKVDPLLREEDSDQGPVAVVVHIKDDEKTRPELINGAVTEYSLYSKLNVMSIPNWRDSWYCRSNEYAAESAATAGLLAGYIAPRAYVEAYKALGENRLPFYIAYIDDIAKGLDVLVNVEREAIKVEDDDSISEKDREVQKDAIRKQYSNHFSNIDKLFNLVYVE